MIAALLLPLVAAAPPASAWPEPAGIDRLSPLTSCAQAAGTPDEARICGWKHASDAVVMGSLLVGAGTAAAYTVTDGAGRETLAAEPLVGWGGGLVATLVTAQVVKTGAQRPRPYTWNTGYRPEAERCGWLQGKARDDCWSFFSGHTALTAYNLFAAASALDLYHSPTAWKPGATALGYTAATVGTVVVGTARVRAGQHFWSDVAVGALVGAGYGLAAPRIAQLLPEETSHPAQEAGAARVTFGAAW